MPKVTCCRSNWWAAPATADLDRATLEMIRRAQPLPKPPADMLTNGAIEIVAPFVYSLEKRRR